MNRTTANWHSPSLCGCVLKMTAEFADGAVIDGVTYQYPINFRDNPISDLEIISVCDEHKPVLTQPVDFTPFLDYNRVTGKYVQGPRGYLKYPIDNPTDAEKLFTALWSISAHTWTLTKPCVCRGYTHFKRVVENGEVKVVDGSHTDIDHPRHRVKCDAHIDDDANYTQLKEDMSVHQDTLDQIVTIMTPSPVEVKNTMVATDASASPVSSPASDVPVSDATIATDSTANVDSYLDSNRVLHVIHPEMNTDQKAAAQAWADLNIGVGKVIIE